MMDTYCNCEQIPPEFMNMSSTITEQKQKSTERGYILSRVADGLNVDGGSGCCATHVCQQPGAVISMNESDCCGNQTVHITGGNSSHGELLGRMKNAANLRGKHNVYSAPSRAIPESLRIKQLSFNTSVNRVRFSQYQRTVFTRMCSLTPVDINGNPIENPPVIPENPAIGAACVQRYCNSQIFRFSG
jgi:hypothetical protein